MQKDYREMTITDKRKFWQEHIHCWRESGLSQSEYCRRNDIGSSQWFYWRKRSGTAEADITFVPLKLSPGHSSAIRVTTPNGFTIELNYGTNPLTVTQLIREVSAI